MAIDVMLSLQILMKLKLHLVLVHTYYIDVEALNYTCDDDTLPGID